MPLTVVLRSWEKSNSEPEAGSFASKPSMRTSTWLASPPRSRSWVRLPRAPAWEGAALGSSRRRSVIRAAPEP